MAHTTAVRAPMVGVFYAAPAPGAEPFVHVGSKVKKGETLCVIEAMKVMNEVTAEADGEVVDICVKDGDLVDYTYIYSHEDLLRGPHDKEELKSCCRTASRCFCSTRRRSSTARPTARSPSPGTSSLSRALPGQPPSSRA